MRMVDVDLIRRKLSRLKMYLEQLAPLSKKSLKEYEKDVYVRYSTERLIQVIVECATDINNHVVVEKEQKPPEDYRQSFTKAADVKLISPKLSDNIKGSAGMRNVLVHEYMDIDDKMVYEAIPMTLKYYKEYLKQVNDYLKKLEK